MPALFDEHMLQGLLAAYGGVLPSWLERELSAKPAPPPQPAFVAACRAACTGDPILTEFATRLSAAMAPRACAGRLRAQEVLLACAASTAGRSPADCHLQAIGLLGPCSFRCQSDAARDALALWRETLRYIKSNYRFSDGPEALAGASEGASRARLERLPLERE